MAMPFIRDLSHSLQGIAKLFTGSVELQEIVEGQVFYTNIGITESPKGMRVSMEVWKELEGKRLEASANTEDLEELADMFAEAADISRSLS